MTSREVRDLQLLNMYRIVLAFEVLKPETSSAVKAVQPANIMSMFSTFDVSNREEKVKVFSEEQPPNITHMVVTFDVSKDDKSRDSSDGQLLNIANMFVTLDVSNLDMSSDSSEVQPRNMLSMLVVLEVESPERSADTRFEQPENIQSKRCPAITPFSITTDFIADVCDLHGASFPNHSPNCPVSAPGKGLTVKHPLSSTLQMQPPFWLHPSNDSVA